MLKKLPAILVAAGVLPFMAAPGPAFAETEAETAARTQRPLTEDERTTLVTACQYPWVKNPAFWSSNPKPAEASEFRQAVIAEMDEMVILGLILRRRADVSGKEQLSRFGDLPKGGIGRAGYCEAVEFGKSENDVKPGGVARILGLRLRPKMNLARDYPTATTEALSRNQLIYRPRQKYLVIQQPAGAEAAETAEKMFRDHGDKYQKIWFAFLSKQGNVLLLPRAP